MAEPPAKCRPDPACAREQKPLLVVARLLIDSSRVLTSGSAGWHQLHNACKCILKAQQGPYEVQRPVLQLHTCQEGQLPAVSHAAALPQLSVAARADQS